VVSYSIAQRRREVGIRMALGALRADILRLMVAEGMRPATQGLALGLLLSFALTWVFASDAFGTELLFGVTATDSLTFVFVTILLAGVALGACAIPALRAAWIHPSDALRGE